MFCCWKIEILSAWMHSPQIKPSLGKLELNISFGDGLIVIRVYIKFQSDVFFFIIATKCWTALASGEKRESESPGWVLNFLKGDQLSLHVGCSGHCTIRSDQRGIWLRPRTSGKGKSPDFKTWIWCFTSLLPEKDAVLGCSWRFGPWDISHCLWEHWRRSLVCQNNLCECFLRGDGLQGELSFSALGRTKEVTLDDFHSQWKAWSQAVDKEVVWYVAGLSLYWSL